MLREDVDDIMMVPMQCVLANVTTFVPIESFTVPPLAPPLRKTRIVSRQSRHGHIQPRYFLEVNRTSEFTFFDGRQSTSTQKLHSPGTVQYRGCVVLFYPPIRNYSKRKVTKKVTAE
jgi:hypothetical protein